MLQINQLNYENDHTKFKLHEMDFTIHEGEIVSLIGPNGSGKSTLLRIASRLLKPNSGSIRLNGIDVQKMKAKDAAKSLAMLPQMNNHQLDLTVRELVEFGRHPHSGHQFSLSEKDRQIVDWAIEVTGLADLANRLLPSMSGGERQRAWIAMTIAQHPKVLLLDEPTTYLDISHQLEVMELVKMLNEKYKMTIVMVLHDINQAAKYSNRLLVLKKGELLYDGNPQCVLCKEMFESIFEIEAEIFTKDGRPMFTPLKRCGLPCMK